MRVAQPTSPGQRHSHSARQPAQRPMRSLSHSHHVADAQLARVHAEPRRYIAACATPPLDHVPRRVRAGRRPRARACTRRGSPTGVTRLSCSRVSQSVGMEGAAAGQIGLVLCGQPAVWRGGRGKRSADGGAAHDSSGRAHVRVPMGGESRVPCGPSTKIPVCTLPQARPRSLSGARCSRLLTAGATLVRGHHFRGRRSELVPTRELQPGDGGETGGEPASLRDWPSGRLSLRR